MSTQPQGSGTVISSRYLLQQPLGNGSFGEVWRAFDRWQAVTVAIKLYGQHVILDEVVLEAQLLTRLREHGRVVTVRNVSIASPMPYVVMDYLPGGSVESELAVGDVSLIDAVRWTRHGLAALAHAHALGVIHRDVKPGNLLLDGNRRAVLSDFGIAEDTIRHLLANPAVYAVHAAPELLAGSPSSVQTDVFAMGCTLYRLLSGRYPFTSDADISGRKAPWDCHRLNPQVPLALTRVVRQALSFEPTTRYADAHSMRTALGDCGVRGEWTRIVDPDFIEVWQATTERGRYDLRMYRRPRSGLIEILVTRDLGAGPRRVWHERCATLPAARTARRRELLRVVAGRGRT